MSLKKKKKLLIILNIITISALILSMIPMCFVSAGTSDPTWSIIQGPNDNISIQIKNDGGTATDPDDYTTWSFPGWVKPSIISTTEDGTLMSVVKDDINNVAKIPNQNGNNRALYEFDFTLYSDSGDYTQGDKALVLALSGWSIANKTSATKIVSNSAVGVGFKIYQNGTLELYKSVYGWGSRVAVLENFTLDVKHRFVIEQIGWDGNNSKMAVYIDGNKLYEYTTSMVDEALATPDANIGVAMSGGWNLQDAKVLLDLTPDVTTKQELASLATEYTTHMNGTEASANAKTAFNSAITVATAASTSVDGSVDYVATLNGLKAAKIEYDRNVIEPINKTTLQAEIDAAKAVLVNYNSNAVGYADLNTLIEEAETLLSKADATKTEGIEMEGKLKEGVITFNSLNQPLDKTALTASIDAAKAAIAGFDSSATGYTELNTLITEAETLLATTGANENQGLDMRTRLDEKTSEFSATNKRLDKTALQTVITSAENIIKGFDNKASGYDVFKSVIDEAKALLNNAHATETQGIKMQNKLLNAIDEFERANNIEPEWSILQSTRGHIYYQIINDGGKAPDRDDYTTWSSLQWKQPTVGETTTAGTEMTVVKDDINIQSVLKNTNGNGNTPWFEFDFTFMSNGGNPGNKPVVIGIHPDAITEKTRQTTTSMGYGIGFKIYNDGRVRMYLPGAEASGHDADYSWKDEMLVETDPLLTDFELDVAHRFIIAQTAETENTRTMTVYIDYEEVYKFTLTKGTDPYYDTVVNNQYISLAMAEGWNVQSAAVKVDITPTTTLEELTALIKECKEIMNTYIAKDADKTVFNTAITEAEAALNGADPIKAMADLKVAKSVFLGVSSKPLDKESLQKVIDYAKEILKGVDANAEGRAEVEAKIKQAEALLKVTNATWDEGNNIENEIIALLEPFDTGYDDEDSYDDGDFNEGSDNNLDNNTDNNNSDSSNDGSDNNLDSNTTNNSNNNNDSNNVSDILNGDSDNNSDNYIDNSSNNFNDSFSDYTDNYGSYQDSDSYDDGYDDGYNVGYNDCYDEVYGGQDGEIKSALIKIDGQLKSQAIIFTVVNASCAALSLIALIITIIFFVKHRKLMKSIKQE